jgi:carboxyl-terminal processing protease
VLLRTLGVIIAVALATIPARATPRTAAPIAPASIGALDIIALEICYTTVMARYYRPVDPAILLGGARRAIVAYLGSRGITNVRLPPVPQHVDRYRAENEIDREVALAVAQYGTRIRTADLVANTIGGEIAALHDPYSVVFAPAAFKTFVRSLDGAPSAGIGAELDVDPTTHAVRLADVFPEGAAAAAGLRAGDTIVGIDGRQPPTTPGDVARALRGKPGTTVRLDITRDGEAQPQRSIVRTVVVVPDVSAREVAGGIGYIRIRSFGALAPRQFDAGIAQLKAAGARAYVVDLRANGGGYRDSAIAVASHFVRGTIFTTRERTGPSVTFKAKASIAPLGAPFAVLIDGDTASAAEIVAGAIQDAKAGTLVGTRTFGKGLIQETFPLPSGGAIKLTTARYLTPTGRDIDAVGIAPDVVVAQPSDARPGEPGHDPQLDRALAILGQ